MIDLEEAILQQKDFSNWSKFFVVSNSIQKGNHYHQPVVFVE